MVDKLAMVKRVIQCCNHFGVIHPQHRKHHEGIFVMVMRMLIVKKIVIDENYIYQGVVERPVTT